MRRPKGLIVRQLKQRWGSMSPGARVMLNRRLIEAPLDAIDYVITHELCHVTEPHHGATFFELLGKVMPDWRRRKQRRERAMA
ncbi:putative metal-dependent hydrolase [Novosphingobium sp. SG707]|nr:putative metal-dependent hydrolase [Novosphingobium sp. SG707]